MEYRTSGLNFVKSIAYRHRTFDLVYDVESYSYHVKSAYQI